jgi:hypothetical protein
VLTGLLFLILLILLLRCYHSATDVQSKARECCSRQAEVPEDLSTGSYTIPAHDLAFTGSGAASGCSGGVINCAGNYTY